MGGHSKKGLLVGDHTGKGGLSHAKDRREQWVKDTQLPAKEDGVPIIVTICLCG